MVAGLVADFVCSDVAQSRENWKHLRKSPEAMKFAWQFRVIQ